MANLTVRRSLWALALCAVLPGPAAAADLVVFAAASLKTALDEIAEAFSDKTGADLALSYAGSSALARQIAQGAPADVFLSANPDWMDHLEAGGHIDPATRSDLLGNSLVLIAHGLGARPVPLEDGLPEEGRLAMAFVEAVPAGIYGKAALEALGLWEAAAPRVVQTDNVRAALLLVSRGEAGHGIVYATDVVPEAEVSVVARFPEDSHPPIRYPAALTRAAGAGARAFLDYLRGPEARAVFEGQGFRVLG